MGDRSHSTAAQEIRSILSGRVAGYQLLLLDYLTPLFHKELLDATKQHQEMLQRPDPTISEQQRALRQLGHLDSVDAQLSEHWKDLHTGLVFRTALFANIIGYQTFLATSILLDYAGHSSRELGLDSWVSSKIEALNNHQKTGQESSKDIKIYRQTVATPIKEMMLEQDHVERRIRIAAAEPYPTGEIYRLIDECDWSTLAMMLIRDRELGVTLYSQKPLDPKSYNDNIAKTVLRKIDEIRDKYFTELPSVSNYTTSKRAQERSARKAAGLPLPPEPSRHPEGEGDWASAAAKGVYNKIISSLGLRAGTSPGPSVHPSRPSGDSPRPSMDSTTHLLSSENRRE